MRTLGRACAPPAWAQVPALAPVATEHMCIGEAGRLLSAAATLASLGCVPPRRSGAPTGWCDLNSGPACRPGSGAAGLRGALLGSGAAGAGAAGPAGVLRVAGRALGAALPAHGAAGRMLGVALSAVGAAARTSGVARSAVGAAGACSPARAGCELCNSAASGSGAERVRGGGTGVGSSGTVVRFRASRASRSAGSCSGPSGCSGGAGVVAGAGAGRVRIGAPCAGMLWRRSCNSKSLVQTLTTPQHVPPACLFVAESY